MPTDRDILTVKAVFALSVIIVGLAVAVVATAIARTVAHS
jgi:hypothetical protein